MAANSNPHDNTYNSTTFSGPVKAGSRRQPVPGYDKVTVPGTVAVTALPNAGYAICSQSAAVKQGQATANVNDICLPSGSMITSITILVTTAFNAINHSDLWVGTRPQAVSQAIGNYAKLPTVGVYDYADNSNWTTTSFTAALANRWKDVSAIPSASWPDVGAGESVDIWTDSEPNTEPWSATHAYLVDEIVSNDGGKYYICVTAGTSAGSGGPTGTGSGISDGSAAWDYSADPPFDRGRAILTINYIPGLHLLT